MQILYKMLIMTIQSSHKSLKCVRTSNHLVLIAVNVNKAVSCHQIAPSPRCSGFPCSAYGEATPNLFVPRFQNAQAPHRSDALADWAQEPHRLCGAISWFVRFARVCSHAESTSITSTTATQATTPVRRGRVGAVHTERPFDSAHCSLRRVVERSRAVTKAVTEKRNQK